MIEHVTSEGGGLQLDRTPPPSAQQTHTVIIHYLHLKKYICKEITLKMPDKL